MILKSRIRVCLILIVYCITVVPVARLFCSYSKLITQSTEVSHDILKNQKLMFLSGRLTFLNLGTSSSTELVDSFVGVYVSIHLHLPVPQRTNVR